MDEDQLLYAVGQGALAVECRESDEETIALLKPLYDVQTALRVITERSFLKTLGGGCSAPVAVSSTLTKIEGNKFTMSLKGAVWSLDGKEEILDTDECEVEIKDGKRCATCPYGFQVEDPSCLDIENLRNCNECPSPIKETPTKKAKMDPIPTEMLANDPHEKCPVQLPIGVDFMGKCPYLESELVTIHGKRPLNGSIIEAAREMKCPFFRDGKFQESLAIFTENNETTQQRAAGSPLNGGGSNKCPYRENRNYCGLVPHDNATIASLEAAQHLGEKLAQNLMNMGATDVMAKAQAVIHSSIGTTSATN